MTSVEQLLIPSAAVASGHMHFPFNGKLLGAHEKAYEIGRHIKNLVDDKNYPCVAAKQSYQRDDYQVGLYQHLGSGQSAQALAQDLLFFRHQQKKSQSLFLSFWAVYLDQAPLSAELFEQAFWKELSHTSYYDQAPHDPRFSSDPRDKNFCFSFGGEAFFVVGLFADSARRARRFPYPTLVFNLYEQFEQVDRLGKYQAMVQQIRERDRLYQGEVNPVVEKYAELWESIQFSGRHNNENWRCPFVPKLKPEIH